VLATVFFEDIVDSTRRADAKGDRGWHDLLETHDKTVRQEHSRFCGKEVKSLGDGFLATFDGKGATRPISPRAPRSTAEHHERI
jgi:class 3 adenylate cyclase